MAKLLYSGEMVSWYIEMIKTYRDLSTKICFRIKTQDHDSDSFYMHEIVIGFRYHYMPDILNWRVPTRHFDSSAMIIIIELPLDQYLLTP